MRKHLLEAGDYNVVVVGWGKGAGSNNMQAAANVRVVGAILAQLLLALHVSKVNTAVTYGATNVTPGGICNTGVSITPDGNTGRYV